MLNPPKKTAPTAQQVLNFEDHINNANSSGDDDDDDDDDDGNPRARKLRRKALLESMPVINLGSQTFSPIGEERPKTPPTPGAPGAPGAAGAKETDAMDLDGKAPADLAGVPPADQAGVTPFDIFGDSDDEGPATWGGGCLSPKTCAKEHNADPPTDKEHNADPPHDKQPRLMPKNYKKKPPMHSGSVYNATELVRRNSTYIARNQSPPAVFPTQEQNAPEIENPVSSQKRSGLSDDEDVDTN
jgi:hypothetical protein